MDELVQLKNLQGLSIIDVKQFENNERDRPDFDSRYLKIIYFILNEGFLAQ